MKKLLVILGVFSIVLVAAYALMWVNKNDKEVTLRETVISKQEATEANFDKTFKVISQTAQVPKEFMEQSKKAFKEIYQPLIEGRYQDQNGSQQQVLMKWVQESNPQFDMAAAAPLYAKIQTVIEAQRNEFFTMQVSLIDIHRQHKVFCSTFLNKNLFGLGERIIPMCDGEKGETDPFCVQIIKSMNIDNVYKSGQENDIDLF